MNDHWKVVLLGLLVLIAAFVPACGGGGGGGGGGEDPTAPAAPSGLTATALSSSSIRLDWTDNADNESGFIVMMGQGAGALAQADILGANTTTCTIEGLLSSTLYSFQVIAYNSVDDAASSVANETTQAPPVAAPSDLVLSPYASSEVLLEWTDNSGDEDGFAIYRGTSPTDVSHLVVVTSANTNSYTDSGLSSEVTYHYEVLATKGGGQSDPSNRESITLVSPVGDYQAIIIGIITSPSCFLPQSLPVVVSGLASITEPSPHNLVVDLLDEQMGGPYGLAPDRSGYQTAWSGGLTTPHGVATTPGLGVKFLTDWSETVSLGGTFILGNCNGAFTGVVFTRLADIPDKPTGLSAVTSSSTSIALTWTDASDDEEGFRIYRGTSSGDISSVAGTVGAGTNTFTDNGLTPSTTYYYEVTAYNGASESERSNMDSDTTDATPVTIPNAPTGLSATTINGERVDLAWNDASGNETHFYIYRGPSAGSLNQLATVSANTSSYSDTSVTGGNTYNYQVRAYNSAGLSSGSNIDSATTPSVPAAPSGLTATTQSANVIRLTWTDNSNNALSFKVYQAVGSCGSTFTLLGAANSPATSVSVVGLSPGTTYCYKIKASNSAGDSAFSNSDSATTQSSGATIRIINDLYNQEGYAQYNSIIRVRIGSYTPVLGAECGSINDSSTERLNPYSSIGDISQGNLIQAGYQSPSSIHDEVFDVGAYTGSGKYCVWLQAGWWDYYWPGYGDGWWEVHPTLAKHCNNSDWVNKEAWFWVQNHYSGNFDVYTSQFLPHINWYGSDFCN
jgi:fibronectin type 3 domain-containing protein